MVLTTMSRDCLDPERRKKVGHYILGPCLGEGTFSKVRIGTHVISREKVSLLVGASFLCAHGFFLWSA